MQSNNAPAHRTTLKTALDAGNGRMLAIGAAIDAITNDDSLTSDDVADLFAMVDAAGGSSLRSDAHKLALSGIDAAMAKHYDGTLGQTVVQRIAVRERCSVKDDGGTGRWDSATLRDVLKLAETHNTPRAARAADRITARTARTFADSVRIDAGKLDAPKTLAEFKTALDVEKMKKADKLLADAQKRHAIATADDADAVKEQLDSAEFADALTKLATKHGYTPDAGDLLEWIADKVEAGKVETDSRQTAAAA